MNTKNIAIILILLISFTGVLVGISSSDNVDSTNQSQIDISADSNQSSDITEGNTLNSNQTNITIDLSLNVAE